MKNYLLLIITFFTFFISQAQLSNKHWLPPLHSRDPNAIEEQYLYLSTAETTPFQVTITTGDGTPINGSPFTLSFANPQEIFVGTGQPTSMFLDLTDVNIIKNNKGLILEGSKDFYASFRMKQTNHAETLISKGKPGIGTSFRLACTINEGNDPRKNFVSSVMATENNTTITLSGYKTGVVFASGAGNITADSQTFTLNEGESIVFSGYSNTPANIDGIIGALVTATKPVAVSTGNALAGIEDRNADLTLDQIVSANQIGSEYIFIKGNGSAEMELPLIVANEPNTEIYVNGNPTPQIILNAGEYYLVPNSFYQGTNNKNIYVKTSKSVYAYQLLGGGASTATSGLNFIPPLSCFFQKSVNIPAVNKIGDKTYSADLMVLTYGNATLNLNGTPININNAQAVLGNTDWVTYRIENVGNNINLTSTGPLAVGVFGYSGTASGFAGYYSGFGSNPEDTNVSVCSSNNTNLFEKINGNPDNGGTWTVPAGGQSIVDNIFNPNINIPGVYIYEFTKDCNSSIKTIPVKVTVNIQQAGNPGVNTTKNTCKNHTTFDLFPLLGTGVTTGGTWSFNGTNRPNGNFNPATDITGDYKYTIPASDVCPELSATVTVTNYDIPTLPTAPITDFKVCDDLTDGNDTNGATTFALTRKTNEITNNQAAVLVTYHLLETEAISGQNSITTYTGANRKIYARLQNTITNCFTTTNFNVVVTSLPIIVNNCNLLQCDADTDRIANVNLTDANKKIITTNTTDYNFAYFTNPTDAEANNNPISNVVTNTPNDQIYPINQTGAVWARVTNQEGCYRVAKVNITVSATQLPATFQKIILEACDEFIANTAPIADELDNDGLDFFDLNDATDRPVTGILAQFTNPANLKVSYYLSEEEASRKLNEIDVDIIGGFRNTTPNLQHIWVRIDSKDNNDCIGLGQYVDLKVNNLPDFTIPVSKTICVDPETGIGSTTLDATPVSIGIYTYTWTPTNPETTAGKENAVFNVKEKGVYKVVVKNETTTCTKEMETEIKISSAPKIVQAKLVSEIFASGLSTIQAVVIGGYGTYEYSLDLINWQTNPIFTNLENSTYTIYARDINDCGQMASNEITTISFPNYFTPNGDGYNESWNIKGLTTEFDAKIYIFDRYGKLLKQINANGNGWDGKFNGKEVPSDDYWFKIEYKEKGVQKEFQSHFSLKR